MEETGIDSANTGNRRTALALAAIALAFLPAIMLKCRLAQ